MFLDFYGTCVAEDDPVIERIHGFLESAIRGIDFKFADLVTSESARAYKPRSEIFQYAFERNGLTPESVVHIGDSYSSDVVGAHQCGIDAVWVNRRKRSPPGELMQLEVSTLSEIWWDV